MNARNNGTAAEQEPPRIVILDDVESARKLYKLFLKHWNKDVVVVECQTGDEAWQELSRKAPDAFITDVIHPGLEIREMLALLAAKRVTYPIIVITGFCTAEPLILKYAGPKLKVSVLEKPVTLEEFLQVMETALKMPERP
jgi:DNA-binding NtrC family response regulator